MTGRRSILCGAFSGLFPPSLLSLISTVYQCEGCLSSQGHGGSWLVCQVLPAISAVSISELAANSGSSRMAHATNLYLATQLLNTEIFLLSNDNRTEWKPIRSVIIRVVTKSDDHAVGV